MDGMERAKKLNEKIQRINDQIDEIACDLYGLTKEEREIFDVTVGEQSVEPTGPLVVVCAEIVK